jgi:hypothetical protein
MEVMESELPGVSERQRSTRPRHPMPPFVDELAAGNAYIRMPYHRASGATGNT